jgi:uncharacterized membrane protein YphA (DoxX/SURF4 family)
MTSSRIQRSVPGARLLAPWIAGDDAFSLGRWFFGIAVAASGVLQLITGEFVRLTAGAARGGQSATWPYVVGVILFATGCAIAFGRKARLAASVVTGLILVSLVFKQVPRLLENPWAGFMWTNPLKAVALAGGGLVTALALRDGDGAAPARPRDLLEGLAVVALAIFLVVCGVQHFVYADFVASLVPSWIPGQRFWTYATGVALIAGGAGLLVPRTSRTAATLSAVMVFLWVLLLHIPRAVAGPNHANETAGVFEALAISGIAFMIASRRRSAT